MTVGLAGGLGPNSLEHSGRWPPPVRSAQGPVAREHRVLVAPHGAARREAVVGPGTVRADLVGPVEQAGLLAGARFRLPPRHPLPLGAPGRLLPLLHRAEHGLRPLLAPAHVLAPSSLLLLDPGRDLDGIHHPLLTLVRGGPHEGHALGDILVELVAGPAERGATETFIDLLAAGLALHHGPWDRKAGVCETRGGLTLDGSRAVAARRMRTA